MAVPLRKDTESPPAKVEDLKKSQKDLKQQLQTVKAQPVARQDDESTRVFNLRQHDMEQKISELEKRKAEGERELQTIMQQKNSTLHSDLRKLAQFMLLESRKIAPAEKELEAKISSISCLKQELQHLFEANIGERKKTVQVLEEQNGAILALGKQLEATSTVLTADFHKLTQDMAQLAQEKLQQQQVVAGLKREAAGLENVLQEAALAKIQLAALERQRELVERRIADFAEEERRALDLRRENLSLKENCEALAFQLTSQRQDVEQARQQHVRQLAHLKHTEDTIQARKQTLAQVEGETNQAKQRLDDLRDHTTRAQHDLQIARDSHTELGQEIAHLHGVRAAAQELQQETLQLLQAKRTAHEREFEAMAAAQQAKVAELEAQFAQKKLQWENEFQTWTAREKAALASELEQLKKSDLDELSGKKRAFVGHIQETFKSELSREGFATSEERVHQMRKQVENVFDGLFERDSRWRFW